MVTAMKRWLWLFFIPSLAFAQTLGPKPGTGGTVTSITCNGVVITNSGTCSTVGQIPGTTTNDSATAGNVGEYISSEVTAISQPVSGTPINVTSIILQPGDWDVNGVIVTGAAATTIVSSLAIALTVTSATIPAFPGGGGRNSLSIPNLVANANFGINAGPMRVSIAVPTTVFLVGSAGFANSTMALTGGIYARRVR